MRKIILFICPVSFCIITFGQDTNYNGPAKSFVNSFWQMSKTTKALAEKGILNVASRIDNMDKIIGIIKEKDPSYVTTALSDEVKALRQLLQSKASASVKENQETNTQRGNSQQNNDRKVMSNGANQAKITELLEFLFGRNNDNLDRVAMKAKTEELLSLDRSGYGKFEIWVKRLKQKAAEAQQRYPKQELICKEETRVAEAQKWYRIFQSYQSYWDAAQKVFPEEETVKNTNSLITNILNGLGTEENLLVLIAKNSSQKVKDTRLPVAKINEASLEKLFMEAYNTMYGESHKGKAIKAIVLSDDWQIQRNEVTGIVTGRLRKGAIVYKNNEGKCFLIQEFFIQQEYVGNAFVSTRSVYAVGRGQEMLCENVH